MRPFGCPVTILNTIDHLGHVVKDPTVQSLLDLQKGSKASTLKSLKQKKQTVAGKGSSNAHIKHYVDSNTHSDAIFYSSCPDTSEESANETDDADDSDMELSDDNPQGDDAAAGFVYTDAQTISTVIHPEGNPELTSYISGASEVPLGTRVDVQATNVLLQEMLLDENAYHKPTLSSKKIPYNATTPQPSSLHAKAKRLMQKAEKNMRKINIKKAVAQKFQEYDQKLEALTNFNVSEAFEKAVQARVLTEIKKLLPTHIPNAFLNYVKPHIGQNENHILGPSTVAIAKKLKAIIQKDELTIADLEAVLSEAKWNSDEDDC
ncbi:hypothetical protein Tco_0255360 [Tanacetum coccineum]